MVVVVSLPDQLGVESPERFAMGGMAEAMMEGKMLSMQESIGEEEESSTLVDHIYVLTPKGVSEKTKLTLNFMKRKMKEYDELKREVKD